MRERIREKSSVIPQRSRRSSSSSRNGLRTKRARLLQDRVWGKMTARLPMQHHLTPDGTSVAHGLLSTTLEDFGRFGMLFTPSWNKAAVEPVVSAEVLKRLQTAGSPAAFRAGAKYEGLKEDFGEAL